MMPRTAVNSSLFASVLAAIGATSCCLLPLALVGAGLSGAWIATARSLEVLQLPFAIVCFASLAYAYYKLYIQAPSCAPGEVCESPRLQRIQRIALWMVVAGILALGVAYTFVGYME